ncbi:hypothetical protein C8T65DRAFT_826145 [Cerioporus squamosus]|nr:hypothetical protein C8T65DRAFT_826145 [Cerioporus squamosus]
MATSGLQSSMADSPPRSSLYPIAPKQAAVVRYDAPKRRSHQEHRKVPAGTYSYAGEPQTPALPSGWSAHVNPEGPLYFVYRSDIALVTDAYVYTPSVQAKIAKFVALVKKTLVEESISWPDSAELYLRPDEDEDTCGYFLLDHASQVVFWLEDVNTSDLGIMETVSDSHLRWLLNSNYWSGVETFPSHRPKRLNLKVDDLIAIINSGEADHRTSETSTFPYRADLCMHWSRMLRQAKDSPTQPYSIWTIARMWDSICNSRAWQHYGEEQARLDYTQKIVDDPKDNVPKMGSVFLTLSYALGGHPAAYLTILDRESTDGLFHLNRWQVILKDIKAEWKQCLNWSLGTSIINLLLFLIPGTSGVLASLSLVCCAGAVLSAFTLLQRHTPHPADKVPDTRMFFDESSVDGHRKAALAFALPRALFMWAAGLASAQGLVWLVREMGLYVLGELALLVLLACLSWDRWGARVASFLHWRRAPEANAYDIVENAA